MNSPIPLILVVEDDPDVREMLVINLEAEGYTVISAGSGEEALRKVSGRIPQLALVDLMLPDIDGHELSQRLKALIDVPIVMLTAVSTEAVVVRSLDQVADDYIVKPFRMLELIARIRRVLRRSQGSVPPQRLSTPGGELVLDPSGRRAVLGSKEANLTPIEFRILAYLAANANKVLSTEWLLNRVWPDGDGDENRLWVYISRLRHWLEPAPASPVVLLTVRRRGYVLRATA